MTVDCVEIGDRQAKIGEVLKVKPLAVLAMIDEGELDWKIVTISVDDPKANMVNNAADVEKNFPVSLLYRMHMILTVHLFGKKVNSYAMDHTMDLVFATSRFTK